MKETFPFENEIKIIKSARRSLALEIKPDGQILVRAPRFATNTQIRHFVQAHEDWIKKHQKKMLEEPSLMQRGQRLSKETIDELTQRAKQVIPERVAYYAPLVGVDYGRITIRHQSTRWGSCSSKGNLNFNCLLMLTPIEVIDSVVVHELCHRKEMNHSKRFYAEVLRVYPDYYKWNNYLSKGQI